jgi:hypothetical protein
LWFVRGLDDIVGRFENEVSSFSLDSVPLVDNEVDPAPLPITELEGKEVFEIVSPYGETWSFFRHSVVS